MSGQDESDDYEYDMAHEVKAYLAAHPPKPAGPGRYPAAGPGGAPGVRPGRRHRLRRGPPALAAPDFLPKQPVDHNVTS